jgi:hypothetical protein
VIYFVQKDSLAFSVCFTLSQEKLTRQDAIMASASIEDRHWRTSIARAGFARFRQFIARDLLLNTSRACSRRAGQDWLIATVATGENSSEAMDPGNFR